MVLSSRLLTPGGSRSPSAQVRDFTQQAGLRPSNTLHRPGEPPSPGGSSLYPFPHCSHCQSTRNCSPLRSHDGHCHLDSKAPGGLLAPCLMVSGRAPKIPPKLTSTGQLVSRPDKSVWPPPQPVEGMRWTYPTLRAAENCPPLGTPFILGSFPALLQQLQGGHRDPPTTHIK